MRDPQHSSHRPSDLDRVLMAVDGVRDEVRTQGDRLIAALSPQHRTLGGFIAAVHGRSTPVATIPVPRLLDTEAIDLAVMPRLRNGHVSVGATVTWTPSGSVTVKVGTEPFDFNDPQFPSEPPVTCPGSFRCTALTPGPSGTGEVVVSGSDSEGVFESDTFSPIEWAPGQPRNLNSSVGNPRPEGPDEV